MDTYKLNLVIFHILSLFCFDPIYLVYIGIGLALIPVLFMSGKKIGEKILHIGSQLGGIAGGVAAVDISIRDRKKDKNENEGKSGKDVAQDIKGKTGNSGGSSGNSGKK